MLSTDGLLPGVIPSLATRNLRAQMFRSPTSGPTAWLTFRPVLWESARAALLLVQGPQSSLSQVRRTLEGRVAILHAEDAEAGVAVYVPWEQRGQLEQLVPAFFMPEQAQVPLGTPETPEDLPSDFRGEVVEVITLTAEEVDPSLESSASGGPYEGGPDSDRAGLQSRPGPPGQTLPRFTQTREGGAARNALLILGNEPPSILDRLSPREWDLPFGISVRELAGLRKTRWEVRFTAIAVEQRFIGMCGSIEQPLILDSGDLGEQDEGATLIQSVYIAAPSGDREARKAFARMLWELVNEAWLMEQRDLMMAMQAAGH
jgi:hypothetical protein